jgi:hypothetical protein
MMRVRSPRIACVLRVLILPLLPTIVFVLRSRHKSASGAQGGIICLPPTGALIVVVGVFQWIVFDTFVGCKHGVIKRRGKAAWNATMLVGWGDRHGILIFDRQCT